ncbi:hypothetical protein KIH32_04740 [Pseudomonas fluorescens]|nr:hypothetical protein [Pseudomonas fluorescens]
MRGFRRTVTFSYRFNCHCLQTMTVRGRPPARHTDK